MQNGANDKDLNIKSQATISGKSPSGSAQPPTGLATE
jgi:hypothetical protein